MEITIVTIQARVPVTILRPIGNLDSGSAGYFTETLKKIIEDGVGDVLIDFSGVPYMSSVGIRCLTAAYDWLHPVHSAEEKKAIGLGMHNGTYKAPHLKLLHVNENISQVLNMVGLDRYIDVFSDERDALATF